MWNGFDLPKQILDEHLEFIRNEKARIETQLGKIDMLKGYEKRADDAETLMQGYRRLLMELNFLIRHDYDAEKENP